MQKLPEVSDRKKGTSRQVAGLILSQAVTSEVTTPCWLVEDATHLSFGVALASPFTSSNPLG